MGHLGHDILRWRVVIATIDAMDIELELVAVPVSDVDRAGPSASTRSDSTPEQT